MSSINKRTLKTVILIAGLIAVVAVGFVLYRWTQSIESRRRQNELKQALEDVIKVSGERGLLEMAGVPVNNIYYGEEGVTLFKGETASWTYSADELQNMAVFDTCSSAVVHINASSDISVSGISSVDVISGTGSGFFVTADGYICTNNHVVSGAGYISVTTADGKTYEATLKGADDENDIAVLKIEPPEGTSFDYLQFASSSSLAVGQKVLAMGNPFGYDRTLSAGIISGLSRPLRDSKGHIMLGMIQTDAEVNPGNSGGPLLNSKGQVIGVCAAIYSSSGVSQGMNFAIASDTAQNAVQDLIRYGKVNRGWIDIVPVQLSEQIVKYAGLKVEKGILVSQVVPNGKAMAAGLRGGTNQVIYGNSVIYLGGDVITKVNGYDVAEYTDLFTALSNTRPGDKVQVEVNRNGNMVQMKLELVERTAENVGWINR